MKQKILVTGAAGFIGSHVAEWLLRAGHDVVAVDDLSGGFTRNLPEGVRFFPIDVADAEAVDELFESEGRFEVIYHLAAYAAEGAPTVVFGPGDIAQAHTCDEWLAVDQLKAAEEIYLAYVRAFCPNN